MVSLGAVRKRSPWASCLKFAWWRHQMETFPVLLAICAGNSPVTGEFPAQRPVTRSFDVFFHLCLNKRLGKQSWGWWFEAPSLSLWRHRKGNNIWHNTPANTLFIADLFTLQFIRLRVVREQRAYLYLSITLCDEWVIRSTWTYGV